MTTNFILEDIKMGKTITIELAKELNGAVPYMAVAFLDSYGDVLLKELTLEDINPADPEVLRLDNYFTPCNICGLPVIDSSIVPNTNEMCDHCERTAADTEHTQKKDSTATLEERIAAARQEAENAFWTVIVKHFPEANDGAFLMSDMDDVMLSWVRHWVSLNVPTQSNEPWTEQYSLHYPDVWHLHREIAKVSCTNVAVAGSYYYVRVSNTQVQLCHDAPNTERLSEEQTIASWEFGDSPAVLMNYIEEFMGGSALWNINKLFDDVMTIGKLVLNNLAD